MAEKNWLEWAVSMEEAAGCDVEAGPDVGRLLIGYINQLEGGVTYEKLLTFLKGELEDVLPVEEIETIANSTLEDVSQRVRDRGSNLRIA
ncbi:hypothetical protein [cf. Phormidesmis sp. LEGE 11477]|uniref:hypothetical protein n=1 Tax=cf. Phormidesmis sp. LEGE 11477 TaxID=1828680 RepID=UPI00188056FD|nr:hypothetical protein [cf. Phormidesmis sp. LEGE 11477]MBE9063832.1 hypothetical protein [cf. Phormidesmis sp. LEGE 11477]